MGIAAYNRGSKAISEGARRDARPMTQLESRRLHADNRLSAAEGTIAELRAALVDAEAAALAASQRADAAEAALARSERDAELWKGYAMRWRRQVERLSRARTKLSAIIRWGLSPERYHELSADYDREHEEGESSI